MPCILLKHRRVQVQFLSACLKKSIHIKIEWDLEKAAEISGELNPSTRFYLSKVSLKTEEISVLGLILSIWQCAVHNIQFWIWSHLTMPFRLWFLFGRAGFLLVLSPALFEKAEAGGCRCNSFIEHRDYCRCYVQEALAAGLVSAHWLVGQHSLCSALLLNQNQTGKATQNPHR